MKNICIFTVYWSSQLLYWKNTIVEYEMWVCVHVCTWDNSKDLNSSQYLGIEGIMECAISKEFSTKIKHLLSWVRFLLMIVFIIKGCHGLASWFSAWHVTCTYCYKPMPLSCLYLLYFVCIDSFEWNKSWHKLYKKYKFPKTAFCCDFSHLHTEATLHFCPLHIHRGRSKQFCKLWKELMKMNHFLILLSSEDK